MQYSEALVGKGCNGYTQQVASSGTLQEQDLGAAGTFRRAKIWRCVTFLEVRLRRYHVGEEDE